MIFPFLNTKVKDIQPRNPFQPWMTISTKVYENHDVLLRTLSDKGVYVSRWAESLLSKINLPTKIEQYDLFRGNLREIGLVNGAYQKQVWQHLSDLQFEKCPAILAAELRLEYMNQPKNEWLRFYMDPIRVFSEQSLCVFEINHDRHGEKKMLHWYFGNPDAFRGSGVEYIYCKKRTLIAQ